MSAKTIAAVLHPWIPSKKTEEGSRAPEESLAEAVSLAGAIALDVRVSEAFRVTRPHPATLLGGGAVETFREKFEAEGVELVIIDHALTPGQQRNLETAWQRKVIDRTGLILEIFGERAQTREGQLQVELASLNFQRSRLVRSWTHLERQRGGTGFLAGPGESQLEIDRRLIEDRITRLRKDLEKVRQTRALQRDARTRSETPLVALVGYTNSGKSTLFNTLTEAGVLAKDMLFATLDPTMRRLRLPSGRECVFSDTVGFISNLPHELVAAFRATLEEVEQADLILHVRDISSVETAAQQKDVNATLEAMGIDHEGNPRLLEVCNKIDLLPEAERREILGRRSIAAISAITGQGLPELLALIDQKLAGEREVLEIELSPTDGEGLAWLYAHGEVLERRDEESKIALRVALSGANAGRWTRRTPEN